MPPPDHPVRAVGGVMPAAEGPVVEDNLSAAWDDAWRHVAAFSSARSALASVLRFWRAPRVWLPAYACPVLLDAAVGAGAEAAFYEASPASPPDIGAIEHGARAGEAVVAIAWFGRPADATLVDLAARRPDLRWIEDRAQCAESSPAWSEAAIYSPRKVVGVADGGVIYSREPVRRPTIAAHDLWAPEDARARDPDGVRPAGWYGLFKAREASFKVDAAEMSLRSDLALQSLRAKPIWAARRRNWSVLARRLGSLALWPDHDPDFTPLAFPILTADAGEAVAALAAERIWAPRHWADPPSPPADFPAAHDLARRLVSLPCDQRYDEADMIRVADAVLRLVQPR